MGEFIVKLEHVTGLIRDMIYFNMGEFIVKLEQILQAIRLKKILTWGNL